MANADELVLLTGGNGVVGCAVLISLCESGYRVRAVVRRQSAIEKTSALPAVAPHLKQIEWVIVPDFTKPDAFLASVKGCNHVIHVASPIPASPPVPEDLRTPATQGTLSMLLAAASEPLIKRVVITGSCASLVTLDEVLSTPASIPLINGDRPTDVPETRPADDALPWIRYGDSKRASAQLVRDWVAQHPDAGFEVVLLCPGWVLGPTPLAANKREAMATANFTLSWLFMDPRPMLNPNVFGLPVEAKTPLRGDAVWIGDVALAHVRSLFVPLPAGKKLQIWVLGGSVPSGCRFEDAREIVERRIPEIAKHFSFAGEGKIETVGTNLDTSAEKELLHRSFVPFEDQVVGSIEWLVGLPDE